MNGRPPSSSSSTGWHHRNGTPGVVDDLRTTSVLASLSKLFLNEKFSDMSITCQGREFKAHRAVVCTQSAFFDRALSTSFMESVTGIVDLPDDDPEIVNLFLQFLYTGNYDDGVNATWGKPSPVAMKSSEEIDHELQEPPGVAWPLGLKPQGESGIPTEKPVSAENGASSNPFGNAEAPVDAGASGVVEAPEDTEVPGDAGNSAAEAFGSDLQDDSDSEPDYEPQDDETSEPEEEYNEFDRTDSGSNQGPADEMANFVSFASPKLFIPLRLYIMADKYDVPALRLLARDRFYRAAEAHWEDSDCFPDVVDELYSSTPETETAMREIVCRLVGCQVRDRDLRAKMEPVMRKHGEFAVGVLNYVLHSTYLGW